MDKLEQEIKNRLVQDSSMTGIESESLWSAISQTPLPAEGNKNRKRFLFLWCFGVILVGSVLWSCLLYTSDAADE